MYHCSPNVIAAKQSILKLHIKTGFPRFVKEAESATGGVFHNVSTRRAPMCWFQVLHIAYINRYHYIACTASAHIVECASDQ